jgi:hypothetical protein
MNYKPASTQKNKLATAELDNQKQAIAISLKKWVEKTIDARVITTQPRNTTLPITTQWDSDWITVTENNTDKLWCTWSIPMGRFNYNWLSRFAIEIAVRNIGGTYKLGVGSEFSKSIGWDIKDVVGSEGSNAKDIKLLASVYVNTTGTPIFQAKLLLKYIAQANHD